MLICKLAVVHRNQVEDDRLLLSFGFLLGYHRLVAEVEFLVRGSGVTVRLHILDLLVDPHFNVERETKYVEDGRISLLVILLLSVYHLLLIAHMLKSLFEVLELLGTSAF